MKENGEVLYKLIYLFKLGAAEREVTTNKLREEECLK